jgi:hypothetical protein
MDGSVKRHVFGPEHEAVIAAVQAGKFTHDTLYDKGNNVWLFRIKDLG